MGQWGLRLKDGGVGVARWGIIARREHLQDEWCNGACGFIVEEHQRWGKPEEADIPEFTIEVAYKTHDRNGYPVSRGWRYALKWKENGEDKSERRYGFESKEKALKLAKEKARSIALTLTPVHVETYTPEI